MKFKLDEWDSLDIPYDEEEVAIDSLIRIYYLSDTLCIRMAFLKGRVVGWAFYEKIEKQILLPL
jgi:hypothetical protein